MAIRQQIGGWLVASAACAEAICSVKTETKTGSTLRDERSDRCEENRASQVHSNRKGRIPRLGESAKR